MTAPADKLHHWDLRLLDDPEYKLICERIGRSASRDQFDDGQFDPNALEWIHQYRAALQNGVFPDIALLTFIGNAFAKYLQASGAITLDEAFGLQSIQRAGNPAAHFADTEKRDRYCFEMLEYLRQDPSASLPVAAEHAAKVLDWPEKPDCESMVKYFGDWRKVFDTKRSLVADLRPPKTPKKKAKKSRK